MTSLWYSRLPVLASTCAALILSPMAATALDAADPFAGLTPLTHGNLQELRGGANVGDVQYYFGVRDIISAQIPNAQGIQRTVGLQESLTFDDSGHIASVTTTPVDSTTGTTSPTSTYKVGNTAISVNATSAPQPATTTAALGASGITSVTSASGTTVTFQPDPNTTIKQTITNSQLQTIITNSASGISVDHKTNIDINLPNILPLSRAISQQLQAARMANQAALAGLHR